MRKSKDGRPAGREDSNDISRSGIDAAMPALPQRLYDSVAPSGRLSIYLFFLSFK
ncbi:MAG TPA: hypothetical protein VMX13_03810 [Sedimentisphaerales bacterium]|nr:hypothetical protein [Sedimentisphaerales bacterium]